MAALNFSDAPFLTYLTVFKARLGALNLLLRHVNLGFTPLPTLERQLKKSLNEKIEMGLADFAQPSFAQYFIEKKLIGLKSQPRGRYPDWTWTDLVRPELRYKSSATTRFAAFRVDKWFADDRVKSTIGVPTPENVRELIDFGYQLRLITRSKNSVTSAGLVINELRGSWLDDNAEDNPFALGAEGVGFLRELISQDGLILHEILSEAMRQVQPFRRDDIAKCLPAAARNAYKIAQRSRYSPPALAEARKFVKLLETTQEKFRNKDKGGPGVLEHRTSPRLEWLCDLGGLMKAGGRKNDFVYRACPDTALLKDLIFGVNEQGRSADDAAHQYWCRSEFFKDLRERGPSLRSHTDALLQSYTGLRRPVGPSPIRDIAFLALVLRRDPADSMAKIVEVLVEWAGRERRITLSGGRYTRAPEFVHIENSILARNN